ncbi:fam-g protein [Plasmodium gallinaceum]|uniref:Fam-g protein n=1 Tax=Plasmodium gallinaceum TaxID=5849 RepID=A0A1J1GTA7_PLAGA|nr:fam-g protein [Plasmodium gallinaceum]CRG95465.1 fam-g protein [Plasmodium gallinaceum]
MKTLTLYLKITTFLLLIWMYECFYNCDSYKTLIDKNILQIKNVLKYERVLTEGDIAGEKQTNAEGCQEECPLDNEKNKCNNPVQYKNQCDPHHGVKTPSLWESFDKKAKEIDPKLREQELNIELRKISHENVDPFSKIYQRHNPDEGRQILILSVTKDHSDLKKLLDECRKEKRDNKAESECKKEIEENKTELESKKLMIDNKTELESMKEMKENKTESESKNDMRDNITEFEWMNEMIKNETECESEPENEMRENKKKNKKSNILKFLFCCCDNH